jgi:antibiotic biosynthesis monooxygenase (ABM) superfamily enzyme
MTTPPRYKLALLTWAGAYAVITLILAVLGPTTAAWPLPLRTLVLSALMAPAMTWLVIPFLTRLFRSWLAPASPAQRHEDGRHHAQAGRLVDAVS